MKNQLYILIFCALFNASAAYGGLAPDEHAPIGVMGEHTHKPGEWMVSYRYGMMKMQDNQTGHQRVTPADVLTGFMVSPTAMQMQMHMFGAMRGISDRLSLSAMVAYRQISMDHVTRMGGRFTVQSEGFGDIKIGGLYRLNDHTSRQFILGAALSLPVGSIAAHDDTPMGRAQQLPYPMQIGSGTYDLLPAITYTERAGPYSWGAQATMVFRLGVNSNGYSLGDQYGASLWAGHRWNEMLSTSVRMHGSVWENIEGADFALNPNVVPTARPDLRGGEKIDFLLGANFVFPRGMLKGNRLAVEVAMPVLQRLIGPQLASQYQVRLGWQLAF